MEIGLLRVRVRRVEVKPDCYRLHEEVDNLPASMHILPFDGVRFLSAMWSEQDDQLWIGSAINACSAQAALVSEFDNQQVYRQIEKSQPTPLASFCFDMTSWLNVIVSYNISAKGKWIGDQHFPFHSVITVLETTKVHIELHDEKHETTLQPGTVAVISPMMLLRSPSKISEFLVLEEEKHIEEKRSIQKIFRTSQTSAELAKRLQLKPASLRNKLREVTLGELEL